MSEKQLLKQLCTELIIAAEDYKSEARNLTAQDSIFMLKLLTNRCETFVREIELAIDKTPNGFIARVESFAETKDSLRVNEKSKAFEQIFERLEKRESQLECLYRRILQSGEVKGELKKLLESQARAVSKWHDFIITEEINFILAGEVRIPMEFQQKFHFDLVS